MATSNGEFQFSLVGMLLAMAVVAIALAVLVVLPDVLATPVIIVLFVALPALLTTRVIYGSGYQRTFCIGALFPLGVGLYTIGWVFGLGAVNGPSPSLREPDGWSEFFVESSFQFRIYAASIWVLAVVIGMLCVLSRWAMERRTRRQ